MLVLSREVHHLGHLRLGDLVGVDPTLPDPVVMNVEHDPSGLLARLVEKPFEHVNDELHGGVVVVQ
jgi:hypothetical protein